MRILVTGGAGFIGRWVVKRLLPLHKVISLDNLSNGSKRNVEEFCDKGDFEFLELDVLDFKSLTQASNGVDVCIHLAAHINVQESLDFPERAFSNNIIGTYNVLEVCRKNNMKLVLVGTCLVYDLAFGKPIDENHPVKPTSPYAASKLASEELAISYYYGYGLPVVITRPFNTYGPYQRTDAEGGVVSIFIKNYSAGKDLLVFGNGEQTRDLLYVEDCADFIARAAFSENAIGEVINAGTGREISINDLASMICEDETRIRHVPHRHPQSEINKLVCDHSKATKLLGWQPMISLEEGIEKTKKWFLLQHEKSRREKWIM